MNITQRITNLERKTIPSKPHGMPIRPSDWTDGEGVAVIKGLGLEGYPILTLCREGFITKYKTYIDKIRADYTIKGITPDKPLIQAEMADYAV